MKKLLRFMMTHTFFLSPAMFICYAIISALTAYAIHEAKEQFAEEDAKKKEVSYRIRPGQDGHGIYRGPFDKDERDNKTITDVEKAMPIPIEIYYNETV